jgi:hypothetical protein
MAIAAVFSSASLLRAEDTAATTPSDAKKVEAKADAPTPAQLRAQMHRTLADLIEARNAEKPDPARIDKLSKELEQLRAQIVAQRAAGRVDVGYGRGYGRGFGCGYGRGFGRGPGWGVNVTVGRGLGVIDQNHNGICDNLEAPAQK